MSNFKTRTTSLFITALLFSGALALPAQAQVADSIQTVLDADQLRDYRRQRLSVEIQTETAQTVEITGNRYQDVFGRTVTERTVERSGNTYKTWVPYKGFDRTTEVEFFNTAGYPDLAREAKDYHTYSKSAVDDAGLAFGLGFGLPGGAMAIGGAASSGEAANRARNIGLGFFGVGLMITLLDAAITPGGEMYEVGPPMRFPASQVSGIAGEYNRELYRKLREAQPASAQNQTGVKFPAQTKIVDESVREALSLPNGARKVVAAETSRLREGDVVVSVEDSELDQENSLSRILNDYASAATVQIKVLREGESQTLTLSL